MIPDDIDEMVEELTDAASLCNDEIGEWWSALAGMYPRVYDCSSQEFLAAYEKEVRDEHLRFKEEFKIEEVTRTHITKTRQLLHESEW